MNGSRRNSENLGALAIWPEQSGITCFGSGALSGKMLLLSIVENDKTDDYLGKVRLSKG